MFYDKVSAAAEYIRSHTSHRPTLGIILGSGLGGLVDIMENKCAFSYGDIPGFPVSCLEGHAGKLVFGSVGKTEIVAMQGRFHYYEGFEMKELTLPVFVMKMLGVESLIVTNACGAINRAFTPGDVMIIEDFINMHGINPLMGANDERFGPRFPDMSEAYSRALIARAEECAEKLGIKCQKGVYAFACGPYFETAAEIRAYAALGADVVGMSTVPETIAANYLGIKVFGLSCITNMATGIAVKKHSHSDVLAVANEAGSKLCALVRAMIESWN